MRNRLALIIGFCIVALIVVTDLSYPKKGDPNPPAFSVMDEHGKRPKLVMKIVNENGVISRHYINKETGVTEAIIFDKGATTPATPTTTVKHP